MTAPILKLARQNTASTITSPIMSSPAPSGRRLSVNNPPRPGDDASARRRLHAAGATGGAGIG